MVRTFNIEISNYGWELEIEGFNEPYENYEPIEDAPVSFGIAVKKDDKVIALYDPFVPKDEAIKEANKLIIFQEECKFIDKHNDYRFDGNLVDSLIYIQKQFIERFKDE